MLMKKTLLLSLLMVLALAARAVEVTFVAPEGYTIQYVQVDNGSYLTGTYDPTSGKVTYAVDLAAGQHSVRAGLHADDGSWDAITGGAQTFTVGETPMTVTYGTDNFAVINLTLLDENGAPFEGVGLQVTDDVLFSVSCTTGADGTAQAYIPADAGTFTYGISTIISRDNVTYARLSQTATLQGKEMNLTLSYAACQQVTLNVPSFDFSSGHDLQFMLYGKSSEASADNVVLARVVSDYMEQKDARFIVPQGVYTARVTEIMNGSTPVGVAQQQLTVGEEPVSVSLDFSGGMLFTVDCSAITTTEVTLYILSEGITSLSDAIRCEGPIMLPQGKYHLLGEIYGDDGNTYTFNYPVEMTNEPVSLTLERENFHQLQFTPSGLEGVSDLPVSVSYDLGDGSISVASGDNVYYWGDYTYVMQGAVWIDGWSYAVPFGLGSGRISVGESDVNVEVDMSGLRAFKASLLVPSVNEVWFTRADGARARLAFVSDGMGLALPLGTYTVTGSTMEGQPVSCMINVTADCPESLEFAFTDSSTGIQSATAGKLSAQTEAGGLRIAAPEGGRVSVNVFDLSGRRVLTAQAGDGEVVSTAALVPGVYVARLGAGSAAATVKFMVR